MSPTSIGRVAAMLRIFGSVSNSLPLLTIGDYYYHSLNKMVKKENGDWAGIRYGYWWV